jgi:hypothetical protein
MALPADPAPDPPYRGESPPALGAPFRRSCQAPPLGTFDTGEFSRRPRGAQHARHLRHQKQFVVERDDARMHRADADREKALKRFANVLRPLKDWLEHGLPVAAALADRLIVGETDVFDQRPIFLTLVRRLSLPLPRVLHGGGRLPCDPIVAERVLHGTGDKVALRPVFCPIQGSTPSSPGFRQKPLVEQRSNVSRILAAADSLQKSLRDGDALVPAHSDLRDISSLRIHPRFGVRE